MIDQNGSLWICGDNWCGQLGNGVPGGKNAVNFVKVMDNIGSASCGGRFAAAIISNGRLWMWGGQFLRAIEQQWESKRNYG